MIANMENQEQAETPLISSDEESGEDTKYASGRENKADTYNRQRSGTWSGPLSSPISFLRKALSKERNKDSDPKQAFGSGDIRRNVESLCRSPKTLLKVPKLPQKSSSYDALPSQSSKDC